jgi:uncharacterized protein (TIGR02147 family)
MQPIEPNYRDYIKRSLAKKCALNPRYSLRAFATSVGLSASHLSRVLNGGKGLSVTTALKVAARLEMSAQDLRNFMDLVTYDQADEKTRAILLKSKSSSRKSTKDIVSLEVFEMMSDWYYFPLVELMRSRKLIATEPIISRKMGLPRIQIKAALDRLVRAKVIKKNGRGAYEIIGDGDLETADDIQSAAIQNHHRGMLRKASLALNDEVTTRDFQSLQLLFNPKSMTRAKDRIREFVRQFEDEFRNENSTMVYQLNIQCFALTQGGTQ